MGFNFNPFGSKEKKSLSELQEQNEETEVELSIAQKKAARALYKDFVETVGELAGGGRLGKIKTYGQLMEKLDTIAPEKLAEKLFDKKNSRSLSFLKENFPDVFDTLMKQKKGEILDYATKDGILDPRKVFRQIDDKSLSPEIKKLMFQPDELKKLNASKTWFEALPLSLIHI